MINLSISSLPLNGSNRGSLIITTPHIASPSHLSSIYATRGSFSNSSSPGGAYTDGSFSPISPVSTAPISSTSMSIFLGMSSSSSVPASKTSFSSHVQSYPQQLDWGWHTSYDLASRVTTNSLPNSATLNPTPLSQALLNVMTDKSAANQSFTDLASPTKAQVSSLLPSKANSVNGGFSEPSTPFHYDHSPAHLAFHSNPSSPTVKVPASTNFSSLLNLQTVPTSSALMMTKNDNPSISVSTFHTASENLTKNLVHQNFGLPSTPMTDLTTQLLSDGGAPPSSSALTDNLMNIMALKDLKDQSFTEIESPIRKRPAKLETHSGNLLNLHQQQPTQEDIQSIVKEFTPKNNSNLVQDIVKEFTPKNQDIQNIVKEFTPGQSRKDSSASLSTHHSSKQGERKTSLNEEEVATSKTTSNFSNSQQVQMILKEFGTKGSSLAEIVQVPLSAGLKSEGLASYLEYKQKGSDKSSGPNSIQDLGYKPFELPKSGISTPTHSHHASSLAFGGRLLSLNSPMYHHVYPQSEGSSPFHAAFSAGVSGKVVVKVKFEIDLSNFFLVCSYWL